ncbi:MAG: adenosine deaminase family protein [Kiritimatiellae bacterium]|nr:adenosine deaminase family protein [Kiritimatiellia bacterium]
MTVSASAAVTPDFLARIPKADIHLHLDGSLRVETLIELAKAAKVSLPSETAEGLQTLVFKEKYADLPDYLQGFGITCAVLQTPEALERVAYELAQDCIAENVPYIEVRFAPQQHTRPGQNIADVLRAVDRGLARAAAERAAAPEVVSGAALPFRYGIIACAMRFFLPAFSPSYAELFDALPSASLPEIHGLASLELARACARLAADEGLPVVALDLAGAENGFPAVEHQAAYQAAAEGLLYATVHAGEAYGPESIYQAITKCHADRIGHGTWLLAADRVTSASVKDPQAYVTRLAQLVARRHITLEVCPTSNLQTLPEIPDIAHHPVLEQLEQGLPVCINTDNRLISRTTPARELGLLAAARADTAASLRPVVLEGFRAAFFPGSPAEHAAYCARAAALYDQVAAVP